MNSWHTWHNIQYVTMSKCRTLQLYRYSISDTDHITSQRIKMNEYPFCFGLMKVVSTGMSQNVTNLPARCQLHTVIVLSEVVKKSKERIQRNLFHGPSKTQWITSTIYDVLPSKFVACMRHYCGSCGLGFDCVLKSSVAAVARRFAIPNNCFANSSGLWLWKPSWPLFVYFTWLWRHRLGFLRRNFHLNWLWRHRLCFLSSNFLRCLRLSNFSWLPRHRLWFLTRTFSSNSSQCSCFRKSRGKRLGLRCGRTHCLHPFLNNISLQNRPNQYSLSFGNHRSNRHWSWGGLWCCSFQLHLYVCHCLMSRVCVHIVHLHTMCMQQRLFRKLLRMLSLFAKMVSLHSEGVLALAELALAEFRLALAELCCEWAGTPAWMPLDAAGLVLVVVVLEVELLLVGVVLCTDVPVVGRVGVVAPWLLVFP